MKVALRRKQVEDYASGFRTLVRLTVYLGVEGTALNNVSADKCGASCHHAEVRYNRLIF